MAASARAEGHAVLVIGQDRRFVEKATQQGLPARWMKFGSSWSLVTIASFLQLFRRERPDWVITNVGKDLSTAGIAAWLLGIPVLHRIGSPGDFTDTWRIRLLHKMIRPEILCCSQYTLDGLKKNLPHVRDMECAAIVPGTRIPDALTPRGWHPLRIIATSQLSREKRHCDLLRACSLLAAEGLEFELRIAGTGPEAAALEEQSAALDIAERTKFLGFLMDVEAALDEADIFVLPTPCEPLGIALEEAMAHGLLPVACNAGGAPEIWPDGLERFLVAPEDAVSAFAGALRELIGMDAQRRAALQAHVQEHARKTFAQETQYRKFMALFPGKRSAHRPPR